MISNNLFDLSPIFTSMLLPFIGAGALAWIAYWIGERLGPPQIGKSKSESCIEMFATSKRESKTSSAPVGSFEHRVRVAFAGVGMDASGGEEYYLLMARLAVGAVMFLVLLLIGLPFITSLIGFAAGWVFMDGWVKRAWSKVRTDVEAELPSLLLRLSSVIQTAPNVPSALEIVAGTLAEGRPLKVWTLEVAARMHSEGHSAMDSIRDSAAGISTSLSIASDLIGRMWTTGGEGYSKAFGAAADNLESVLDARVLARAKGGSAQGTVNILTAMTFVMIAFMSRNPSLASTMKLPLVQVAYAVICLVIVFGHSQVTEIIENVV